MKDRKLNFVEKSNKKFNNFYNYEKFIYVNNLSKSIVTCPIHGDFEVKASDHMSKNKRCGCRKCWEEDKNNKLIEKHEEDFIKCRDAAFKYDTKDEFRKKDKFLYEMSYRLGFMDKISSHMVKIGNLYHRCIYSYEFVELKSVYVGLTYDIFERDKQHRCSINSPVYEFSKINNVDIPNPKQLTNYIDKNDASDLEGKWLDFYKNKDWVILNKGKTGGLGGNNRYVNYTKEECFEIASRYDKVSDCEKNYFKVCQILRKKGLIKEAFPQVYYKFKIVSFDSEGNLLKEYDNPTQASIDLKIPISRISACVMHNGSKYSHGYQFIKHSEWVKLGSPSKIGKINFDKINYAKIIQLSRDGEFLNEFNTIADSVKFLGKKENCRASITKTCKGRLKTAYGYKWMYKEDYDKIKK